MDIQTPSDIAFSPAVKAQQSIKGSREIYARVEEKRPWSDTITLRKLPTLSGSTCS